MNLFITLLENVNKSHTSANNVSLIFYSDVLRNFVPYVTLTFVREAIPRSVLCAFIKLSNEAMTTYYFHSCTCVRAAVRASRTCLSETAEDI
jgi:hypothetical protein